MVLNSIGGVLPAWLSPPAIGSIAMILSLIVTPLVSAATKKFDEAHIAKVFGEAPAEAEVAKARAAEAEA